MVIDFNDEPYPKTGTTERGEVIRTRGDEHAKGSRSMLARENWEMYLKLSCTTKKFNDYFAAVAFESR